MRMGDLKQTTKCGKRKPRTKGLNHEGTKGAKRWDVRAILYGRINYWTNRHHPRRFAQDGAPAPTQLLLPVNKTYSRIGVELVVGFIPPLPPILLSSRENAFA